MGEITSFRVDYKSREGWHVFTSASLPGLYVASQDPKKAYEDIGGAIAKLVELDTGIACRVTPELSFAEFVQAHQRKASAGRSSVAPVQQRPPALASQRYALVECA
jgi:hypothetical protein